MNKGRILKVLAMFFFMIASSWTGRAQSSGEIGDLYAKLDWRCIGPAAMGGRTVDIDVVEKKPWIIFAAIGPSGVWRTTNNGITWHPVFHEENTVSTGDVTISQSHPDIVWVGTGEATCRNSVSIGDGVYKSMDGGKTWTNMGLEDTRHISRIVINPGDPNIVYAAAMGHLWGPNEERGIYKTIDGGRHWEKVLYIDENTGFADLAMDPSDSLILYAAAYEHRRLPYHFSSGGPGSGLYKTEDGGKTWKKLKQDLPGGITGRIGIGVSRSNPDVVYALIEHKDAGIWRSEDKGATWQRVCDKKTYYKINNRPFYYSQIRVDPNDDSVIYVLSTGGFVSKNAGKKFKVYSGGTHSDHHALWIDPRNSSHLIDGNDGGIDITYDGGKNWRPIRHMSLAEVYQLGFDRRAPYHVYCGLQDNGLWGGPSRTLDHSGITNADWELVGGGDGFYAQVDPLNDFLIYGNSQVNGLFRYDLRTGQSQTIKPLASINDSAIRYNWNAPIHISPHDPKVVYTGGNHLFRTEDGGHKWTVISPDLTTDAAEKQIDSGGPITPENTGAEIHCTITTIAESPVIPGVIWCGTDDGLVQVTRDGAKTWMNVVGNVPGLPPNTWCSRIEASHFHAATAYAAFDGHRNDDYDPYVYMTEDYGRTWKSLSGNLPSGWIHLIREDLKNQNLLYVGTEFGVFASLDAGESWFSMKNNLPTAAVRDIAVHPLEHDLIIGTHGRGVWILDDTAVLQEMSSYVLESDMHVFSVRPCTQFYIRQTREPFSAIDYSGKNPDYGVNLAVYFKQRPKEKPEVLIKDAEGVPIIRMPLRKKAGLQRKIWNFQYIPKDEEGNEIKTGGSILAQFLFVRPGTYTADFRVGERTVSREIVIRPDPRASIDERAWLAQKESFREALIISRRLGLSVTAIRKIRRQLDQNERELSDFDETAERLIKQLDAFKRVLQNLEEKLIPQKRRLSGSREQALRGGPVSSRVLSLLANLGGYPKVPTETDLRSISELRALVDGYAGRVNRLIKEDLSKLNNELQTNDLKTIKPPAMIKNGGDSLFRDDPAPYENE